jgi:hypothetical protein
MINRVKNLIIMLAGAVLIFFGGIGLDKNASIYLTGICLFAGIVLLIVGYIRYDRNERDDTGGGHIR